VHKYYSYLRCDVFRLISLVCALRRQAKRRVCIIQVQMDRGIFSKMSRFLWKKRSQTSRTCLTPAMLPTIAQKTLCSHTRRICLHKHVKLFSGQPPVVSIATPTSYTALPCVVTSSLTTILKYTRAYAAQ